MSSERDPVAPPAPRLAVVGVAVCLAVWCSSWPSRLFPNGWIRAIAFSLVPRWSSWTRLRRRPAGGPTTARHQSAARVRALLAVSSAPATTRLDDLMGQVSSPFRARRLIELDLSPAIIDGRIPAAVPDRRLPGPRWPILAGVVIVGLSVSTSPRQRRRVRWTTPTGSSTPSSCRHRSRTGS